MVYKELTKVFLQILVRLRYGETENRMKMSQKTQIALIRRTLQEYFLW